MKMRMHRSVTTRTIGDESDRQGQIFRWLASTTSARLIRCNRRCYLGDVVPPLVSRIRAPEGDSPATVSEDSSGRVRPAKKAVVGTWRCRGVPPLLPKNLAREGSHLCTAQLITAAQNGPINDIPGGSQERADRNQQVCCWPRREVAANPGRCRRATPDVTWSVAARARGLGSSTRRSVFLDARTPVVGGERIKFKANLMSAVMALRLSACRFALVAGCGAAVGPLPGEGTLGGSAAGGIEVPKKITREAIRG